MQVWRRADCNSPIGRECWPRPVPEPEHIGWPQDHWTAAHQSCRPRRSCQMPLPQRKPTRSSPVNWRDSAYGCTREAMPPTSGRWRARPVSRDAGADADADGATAAERRGHRDHISAAASTFPPLPLPPRFDDSRNTRPQSIGVRLSYIASPFPRRTGSFWRPIPSCIMSWHPPDPLMYNTS
ncbi:hypothetical protein J3F83DRAFT_306769 [Trichoderma novae-zelandiae]